MTRVMNDTQVIPMGAFETIPSTQVNSGIELGAKINTADGRSFRYAFSGAVALDAGTLLQAPAQIANHQALVVEDAETGAKTITVTLGATALTANYYAGGQAIVSAGTGIGFMYQISSNPSALANGDVVISLEDPLLTDLDSTSRITLVPNLYNGVIVSPTTLTSSVVGATPIDVPASTYFWMQVHGICPLLSDGGAAVGIPVVASNGTAGAVEDFVAGQPVVGHAAATMVTATVGAVFLEIE